MQGYVTVQKSVINKIEEKVEFYKMNKRDRMNSKFQSV